MLVPRHQACLKQTNGSGFRVKVNFRIDCREKINPEPYTLDTDARLPTRQPIKKKLFTVAGSLVWSKGCSGCEWLLLMNRN